MADLIIINSIIIRMKAVPKEWCCWIFTRKRSRSKMGDSGLIRRLMDSQRDFSWG
jgi:hypothetical protein